MQRAAKVPVVGSCRCRLQKGGKQGGLYDPGVANSIDYALPGPLTNLASVSPLALERISGPPAAICWPVHALVIQPHDAKALGLPDDRLAENQVRPAASLIEALLTLNPAPLDVAREPGQRVIGTCRHFALLSCALLRYRGVEARVRSWKCSPGMNGAAWTLPIKARPAPSTTS